MPGAESSPRAAGVLAGVKVVEFAQNAAVPQCGLLMAGMGADVVKVEPPTGDIDDCLGRIKREKTRADYRRRIEGL